MYKKGLNIFDVLQMQKDILDMLNTIIKKALI